MNFPCDVQSPRHSVQFIRKALLSHFIYDETEAWKRSSNLPNIKQLVNDRAKTLTEVLPPPQSMLFPIIFPDHVPQFPTTAVFSSAFCLSWRMSCAPPHACMKQAYIRARGSSVLPVVAIIMPRVDFDIQITLARSSFKECLMSLTTTA